MCIKTKNKRKYVAVASFIIACILQTQGVQAIGINPTTVIELTNHARQQQGLLELQENESLTLAAKEKAQDMLAHDYFAHISPQGLSPWHWFEKSGYDYRYAGENLAMHFTNPFSQQRAWMDSESHRRNILKKEYSEIGVAVASGIIDGRQTTVTVQMFGSQM